MRQGATLALVLSALLVAGCRAAANTPRGTAERFLDAHYVRIDLPAALEFTSGVARQKVETELRLVQGQAIDETTRKPSVHYRLLEEHPDGAAAVRYLYRGSIAIELRLRLLPLVRRRLVVDRVLVEEPVVNLVRTESGAMNVDSLGKRTAPSGAPAAAGAAAAAAPAFQLASLRL